MGLASDPAKDPQSEAASTKLRQAARIGDVAEVERLLTAKVDPNVQDLGGATAMMSASQVKDGHGLAAVEVLLAYRADPNLKNKHNQTALMWSARHGCEKIVDTLLRAGADSRCRCKSGYNARNYAKAMGHDNVIAVLPEPLYLQYMPLVVRQVGSKLVAKANSRPVLVIGFFLLVVNYLKKQLF
eukprot:gnl/MRDRNA2_/MRDRNA2_98182_c0_seq1.p1 gnl/MRDRNA2_/MRDRNA2_98182_c0~~gnl/MRDRNA2_/MRDRNA2_98182_c0_seq1.p1  ORF type:complete len:185 (-),score=34.40 gnl/MRDRNA2_/MRDRNA2_98182_c0_seq1:33-587(-)